MLREEVLKTWKSCREKMINFKKWVDFLAEEAVLESSVPFFPTGRDTIIRNVGFWTSFEYQVKLNKNKDRILENGIPENESLLHLQTGCLDKINMFKELMEIIASTRPTIEEVD
jgi:hypothetical protein